MALRVRARPAPLHTTRGTGRPPHRTTPSPVSEQAPLHPRLGLGSAPGLALRMMLPVEPEVTAVAIRPEVGVVAVLRRVVEVRRGEDDVGAGADRGASVPVHAAAVERVEVV